MAIENSKRDDLPFATCKKAEYTVKQCKLLERSFRFARQCQPSGNGASRQKQAPVQKRDDDLNGLGSGPV
jgi:hypothetical protein